ncbi:MAG: YggS family pyridoxal phosphate-dependent enzyme, partial [Rhodospirillaceae bacterium]|nr:YggS family pyridoxal phosphate-dependent enzyme [Rhodospirillaceae bacterium]
MTDSPDVASNLATVKATIAAGEAEAGRQPGSVRLVAVSKIHDADRIRPALDAGHRMFGENRVQEASHKWPELRSEYQGITLHLIGPLQTNKVKLAVQLFDVIETVDREKLARALAREMQTQEKRLGVFIQINTGEEEQKAGIAPAAADAFIKLCTDELKLDVQGLMCIPPIDDEPSMHFALLAKIAERNGLE